MYDEQENMRFSAQRKHMDSCFARVVRGNAGICPDVPTSNGHYWNIIIYLKYTIQCFWSILSTSEKTEFLLEVMVSAAVYGPEPNRFRSKPQLWENRAKLFTECWINVCLKTAEEAVTIYLVYVYEHMHTAHQSGFICCASSAEYRSHSTTVRTYTRWRVWNMN